MSINKDFDNFKRKRQIQEPAENTKMVVVGILVLSVMAFTFMGKEAVKPILWQWVAFMVGLLIICVVQDILVHKKIKREGL